MNILTHIKMDNEMFEEDGLDMRLDKESFILGDVSTDLCLLFGQNNWNKMHIDESRIALFLEWGEKSFAMGSMSHQIADKKTHGESPDKHDGYAFEKGDQLPFKKLAEKYPIEQEEIRKIGHRIIENTLDRLYVYSNRKPGEIMQLEMALEQCPNRLANKICLYHNIGKEEFLGLKKAVKRINYFLANEDLSRKSSASIIYNHFLKNNTEKDKKSAKGSIDIKKILGYAPPIIVKFAIYLIQTKVRNILPFDEAKNLIKDSYLDFLKDVKGSIKEAIMPYLESPKWSG